MSRPPHVPATRRVVPVPREHEATRGLDAPRPVAPLLLGALLVAVLGIAVAWGTVRGQSPAPSQQVAPLPVRIVEGTCEEPADRAVELSDAMALEAVPESGSLLYLSLTDTDQSVDELGGEGRALLAGGSDVESAIACGELGALTEKGQTSVLPLSSLHGSGHSGVALLRGSDEGTVVEVVVVSPVAPEASPGLSGSPPGSPAASPAGSPAAGSPVPAASGLSPVRSAEPGTSGAPPFSPLPAGTTAP